MARPLVEWAQVRGGRNGPQCGPYEEQCSAERNLRVKMKASRRTIPGFGLSMGFSLSYLSLLVLIPLGGLVLKSAQLSWGDFWRVVTDPIVVASYRLSLRASF